VFTLAVGFVDLVGYTEWSESVSLEDQRRALGDFERAAADLVATRGGRLVKTIGDAAMFVTTQAADACRLALDLCAVVDDHPHLTALRGAVGYGDLLGRDGDYFGPVVNLVARAVDQAPPGRVVATQPVDGFASSRLDPVALRGIEEPVALWLLGR
jgi:adenylate cyclase